MTDITTLKDREDLGEWLNQAGLTWIGVEVGTLYGEYMESIMRKWTGMLLYCVDPWEKQDPSLYREPVNNCDWNQAYLSALGRSIKFGGRVSLIKGYSPDVSGRFTDESLDFVYLDGRHDRDAVSADLEAWWPLIKKGGLFGGHDFRNEHNDTQCCDVQDCVMQFAIEHELAIHTTNVPGKDQGWWIIKPN